MRTRIIYLVGISCLTFLESAFAQPAGLLRPPMPSVPGSEVVNLSAMYEDIEIMRRLLNMALLNERGIASFTGNMGGSQGPPAMGRMQAGFAPDPRASLVYDWQFAGSGIRSNEPQPIGGAEGIYVDGYGVIFSLTLPLEYLKNATGSTRETRQSLSEWDRIQKEVRGEKAAGQDPEPGQRTESLTDKILHTLARHGHRFTQLPDSQKLAVAITLRPMGSPPMTLILMPGGPQPMGGGPAQRGLYDPPVNQQAVQVVAPKDMERELEAGRVQAKNHAILGDQRIRTAGRTKEAIDAYARAVEMYDRMIQAEKAMRYDPAQMQADLATFAELYSKLAAANLVLGNNDGATEALQNFAKNLRGVGPMTSAQGPSARANRLPPKLIVSVSKQMARQLAAHSMTFEEFKSAADVKLLHLNSQTTEARPAKGASPGGTGFKDKPEAGSADPAIPGSADQPPDNKPGKP